MIIEIASLIKGLICEEELKNQLMSPHGPMK